MKFALRALCLHCLPVDRRRQPLARRPVIYQYGTLSKLSDSFGAYLPLEDAAQNLATDVFLAGLVVGHYALGGRHDRHTKAICNWRNIVH